MKDHPGGADSILLVAGEDATDDFLAIHSIDARQKLAEVRFVRTLFLSYPFTLSPFYTSILTSIPSEIGTGSST